jgi:hypothetical protein
MVKRKKLPDGRIEVTRSLEIKLVGTDQYNSDGGYRQDLIDLLGAPPQKFYLIAELDNLSDLKSIAVSLNKKYYKKYIIGHLPNKTEDQQIFKEYLHNRIMENCPRSCKLVKVVGGSTGYKYGVRVAVSWKEIED